MIKFLLYLRNKFHNFKFKFRFYFSNKKHNYKHYNANSLNNSTFDCSIRGLSKYLDISWDDAFDIFAKTAKRLKLTMDDTDNICIVFAEQGLSEIPIYNKTLFIDELAKKVNNIKFICDCVHGFNEETGHIVAIENGCYYDSFDSGDYFVTAIYCQEKDKHLFEIFN